MATDGFVDRWNNVAYAAVDERRMASVDQMPGPSSAPFSARSGRRVNNSGLAITVSSTGNGSVTVSAGAGRIYGAAHSSHGGWDYELPSAIGPITLAARPAVGQSRIDLVVARIYDQDISVGAVRELKIEVVPGSAGASPSAPTVPALSHVLGTLTVPASGTISLTSSTQVAVSAGGVLPVATTAERDALSSTAAAYPGLTVYNAQTTRLETYTGSAWVTAGDADSHTGTWWGTAFNALVHKHKTHSVMAAVTPNGSGNVILISDLSTLFAGVSAVVATPGNSASAVFQVATSLVTNSINANLRNSSGAVVTSGVQTVGVVVHGWI